MKALAAFGAARVFWGTDFSRLDIPYSSTVTAFQEHLGLRDNAATAELMGTALCCWLEWDTQAAA